MLVETRRTRLDYVGLLSHPRQSDERGVRSPRRGAQAFRKLVAVHFRHVEIDEGHVGPQALGRTQGAGSVTRGLHGVPVEAQEVCERLRCILVVVHDEYPPARIRA